MKLRIVKKYLIAHVEASTMLKTMLLKLFVVLNILSYCQANDEWAVCLNVHQAKDVDLFARHNNLKILAEVIPGSDCYQVTKASSRSRRSIHSVNEQLEKDPLVDWSEELKPLVRVKRVPLPSR